jgi:biopolymer transport protein ExbB
MSPAVVAGGMKVALITTVGGLIVAVILQIFFNYIVTQVEALTIDMENASITLVDMLVKYQENK